MELPEGLDKKKNAAEVSAATVPEDKEVQHQMDRKDRLEGDYKEW